MHFIRTLLPSLLAVAAVSGCFFGEAVEPATPTPDLSATIAAALARIAANEAAELAGSPSPVAAPATAPIPTRIPVQTMPPPTVPSGPPSYDLAEVRNWEYAGQNVFASVTRIQAIPWIADGLQTVHEFNAAERMVNIAINAPNTLAVLLEAHSLGARLTPLDLPALLSLQRMAQDRPERLAQLTAAGWFRDGLTEAEVAIVAVLYERSQFRSPEFDDIVSNPGRVSVELRYATNRAGESIPIALIRDAGELPPESSVMATAQSAIPIFEQMFDAPFPASAIVFHVTDYVAGTAAGTNYQTHITLKKEIDANERPNFNAHAVFHEIAHYYLYAHPEWYAEGGADFAASYARHITAGRPIEATNHPCAAAASLSELEKRLPTNRSDASRSVDPDLWQCNYSLGERLLLSLYNYLGLEKFLQGWRALYRQLAADPSYPSQRIFSEAELRVAWLRAGGMLAQPDLEHIWDQWYRGTASRVAGGVPDSTPPDPSLPAVNGQIDRAYIALAQNGPAVDSFSVGETRGWVYLTLEYSYALAGNARELPLEVVEYYEDGFTTGRRNLSLTVESQYAGGTQWLSVGPMPPSRWAPGRYWAYVYESGNKVAEVEYEVTE